MRPAVVCMVGAVSGLLHRGCRWGLEAGWPAVAWRGGRAESVSVSVLSGVSA